MRVEDALRSIQQLSEGLSYFAYWSLCSEIVQRFFPHAHSVDTAQSSSQSDQATRRSSNPACGSLTLGRPVVPEV